MTMLLTAAILAATVGMCDGTKTCSTAQSPTHDCLLELVAADVTASGNVFFASNQRQSSADDEEIIMISGSSKSISIKSTNGQIVVSVDGKKIADLKNNGEDVQYYRFETSDGEYAGTLLRDGKSVHFGSEERVDLRLNVNVDVTNDEAFFTKAKDAKFPAYTALRNDSRFRYDFLPSGGEPKVMMGVVMSGEASLDFLQKHNLSGDAITVISKIGRASCRERV